MTDQKHADPSSEPAPARFLNVLRWLAAGCVVVSVAEHGMAQAVAGDAAWPWAVAHVLAALATVPLGTWLLDRAYPLRGLARLAGSNPAAAIQHAAHLLGATVLAVVSWGGGDAASLGVSAAFWALGIVATALIGAGHRLVTRYRDQDEVADGNLAAALASAGLHVGVALVVGHAVYGPFAGWSASLSGFALALLWVLVLYPLRQVVLARLILRMPPRELDLAVSAGRDAWLGAAEGATCVISALTIVSGW